VRPPHWSGLAEKGDASHRYLRTVPGESSAFGPKNILNVTTGTIIRVSETQATDPADGSAPARVTLYSRRTCGLCDEARAVIEGERRRLAFPFEEVFIDGDDDLERDYGLRVPVILVGGVERFEYHVDPTLLRAFLGPA
jgi:glutaredoxin